MRSSAHQEVVDLLKRINALCMAPHWEPARRWRIEELSQYAINIMRGNPPDTNTEERDKS